MRDDAGTLLVLEPGAGLYGTGRTSVALVRAYRGRGFRVVVWTPVDNGLRKLLEEAGAEVAVWRVPLLRRQDWSVTNAVPALFRMFYGLTSSVRRARRLRGSLVGIHAIALPNVLGLLLSRMLGVPLLWSIHETVRSPLERRVFGTLLHGAAAVAACSQYAADQFKDLEPVVIYSGVDLSRFSDPPGGPILGAHLPEIVCIGRLNRWKGQDVLLHALSILRDAKYNFHCTIVGGAFETDGSVTEALYELKDSLDLSGHVGFSGEVPDVRGVLAHADIAVFPSKVAEPFGKAVVEAMAFGRVVVATRAGGPKEVIRHGVDGILVEPGNAAALADGIRTILDDPDWARGMAASGAVRARDFDEAVGAARYADLMCDRTDSSGGR